MKDPLRCCEEIMTGVEYYGTMKEHYDGVSEWKCEQCNKRIGRWTMKILKNDEYEKPYGGK